MNITEILIERETLDTYTDKALKYKMQVNKIASLKDREASFMPVTAIPKTAKNTRLLMGLGIPSDQSSIPYLKPNCELRIEGFSFISKGWIGFEESGDEYKVKIYSGVIQFFKAIEGKTLGNDLDLSIINKDKTVQNVIDSFTNPAFRYLITDYNGKTHYGTDDKVINIDYLVPSVNVAYLWDLIHKTFGFSYSGVLFSSSHFNNLWITYPKPIEQPVETSLGVAEGVRDLPWQDTNQAYPETWFKQIESGGFPHGNKYFKVQKTGRYRLKLRFFSSSIDVVSKYFYYSVNQVGQPFLNRPNSIAFYNENDAGGIYENERVIDLNAGDEVDFYTQGYFQNRNGVGAWKTDFRIELIQIDTTGADFSEQLSDFSITDFMKDIFNMFGLTPFTNEFNNNISYKLITERYETADVLDWSKKYVRRKDETYIFDAYAKQNFFRWQYNDKSSDYNDSSLNIPNLNLAEKKDIFKSKMYSPERFVTNFYLGSIGRVDLRVFKMYDKNVKESGGQTKIEYKPLDKRFHYCRSAVIPTTVEIGSETFAEKKTINSIAVIDFSGLTWNSILNTFYKTMGRVLIDSRLHEIELNLDATDVILLDQSKMIYFEQEQQYYVIDSIEYDGDEVGVGKFVRVKRDPNAVIIPTDPTNPADYVIPATWEDGTNGTKESSANEVRVKMGQTSFPVNDPIVAYQWESLVYSDWNPEEIVDRQNGNIIKTWYSDYTYIRIRAVTQAGISYYSNTLIYHRL